MSQPGTLSVGGQSFSGWAILDHPVNACFQLARSDIPPEHIHVGMTGSLKIDERGAHTVQITRRDGPRVRFKILT